MKKHRSLLILTGALAVLVIVYLGLGSYNRKQEQKEAETAEENTVTVTDISDLQEISYQYEGNDFAFAKNEDVWYTQKTRSFQLHKAILMRWQQPLEILQQ